MVGRVQGGGAHGGRAACSGMGDARVELCSVVRDVVGAVSCELSLLGFVHRHALLLRHLVRFLAEVASFTPESKVIF